MQIAWCEVGCERIRQPQVAGQLGRIQAGAQQPDGHLRARTGHGDQSLSRLQGGQKRLQLGHVAREIVFVFDFVAAQGAHGGLVCTGGTAQAEVDAARVQLGQGAKRFGHYQRRMVGQHDAA